jgi:hypothetical protein
VCWRYGLPGTEEAANDDRINLLRIRNLSMGVGYYHYGLSASGQSVTRRERNSALGLSKLRSR